MKIKQIASISLLLILIGCADTQSQQNNTNRPTGVKVRTAVYTAECRNCMAKFKITLSSQKFTKELLYKTCPSCKRD